MQARAKASSPKVQEVVGLIDKMDRKDYGELFNFFESFKQSCSEKAESEDHYVLLDFLECAAEEKARELEAVKAHCEVLCSDIASIKGKNVPKPNSEHLVKRKSRVHSNFNEVLDDYIRVQLPALKHHTENTSLPMFADTLKHYREVCRRAVGNTIVVKVMEEQVKAREEQVKAMEEQMKAMEEQMKQMKAWEKQREEEMKALQEELANTLESASEMLQSKKKRFIGWCDIVLHFGFECVSSKFKMLV